MAAQGSSPLARGALSHRAVSSYAVGLIPAGAGSTRHGAVRFEVVWAHPRWRGEHPLGNQKPALWQGSSPLARGALVQAHRRAGDPRLIPAGAGSTSLAYFVENFSPAHPRWRGEHASPAPVGRRHSGSSPLARGARKPCSRWSPAFRLIPAGAGSTSLWIFRRVSQAAHPRWRGEHRVR